MDHTQEVYLLSSYKLANYLDYAQSPSEANLANYDIPIHSTFVAPDREELPRHHLRSGFCEANISSQFGSILLSY